MSAESEGRAAAERFRANHHLGFHPLGDLVTLIEQTTSADVAVLDTEVDQHGMTMKRGEMGRLHIAVARTRRPMRQRSTLAHELAHVVFEDWSDTPEVDSSSPAESRANAFARHLLIPLSGVNDLVTDSSRHADLVVLSKVVQWFQVSPSIAAIALEQAGYIDAPTKARFKAETTPRLAARFGWTDQYHALQIESNRRRAPQRLLARAISGWQQNVVSAEMIATLRGLDVESAERELRDAGIVRSKITPAWTDPADLPAADIDLTELDAAELGDGGPA
ncbi:ImmA/IrrE family metallo-endopeptidase [Nocardia sp. CA2R105]|uniref:ImmA/IrrE family metallo-endopeptidase n=1 Tax=Nocardia coffeae TaxID=2873381 RepID=UPI001CA63843|nr:ImmA/IrrE family metallo-endopeptidase [Nocardia coffeae]MBY8856364.1 ImmA/IrrE family metallo-endopeptidase [Nocardia coffeae]